MARKAFAMILCDFNDVPSLTLSSSYFTNLISPGPDTLLDYWNKVSYGAIDLSGSALFGPWTMKYSYLQNGANPEPNQKPRAAWIAEAKRLAATNGVDLSPFYGVIAVINANADDSNSGQDVACGISWQWGQQDWRWCNKCQALYWTMALVASPCPGGGVHDLSSSWNYLLVPNQPGLPGQTKWRMCTKCRGTYYSGNPTPGACPAGGLHSDGGLGDYVIGFGAVGYPGQNGWKWCNKCQMLVNPGSARCAAGGNHDVSQSADYTVCRNESNFNLTFLAHETGHAYGLGHSWSAKPEVEYGNPGDIMGSGGYAFADSRYSPAGPGVEAANLDFLGWIPGFALWTNGANQGGTETIRLLPLNNPSLGYLAAKVSRADVAYYIDYRQPSGWDRGFQRAGVFINDVRTWQWCNKCQQLTSVLGGSLGQCAAGGMHDHTGSWYYTLLHDTPAGETGQNNWQWCRKCQALTYAGGPTAGVCPAGGGHDHQGSSNYILVHDTMTGYGQRNWRYCRKCAALAFAGGSPGACAARGTHDLSASFDYDLFMDSARHAFLWGGASGNQDLQPGQVFVDKPRGLGFVVHSFDQSVPQTATVSIANLQNGWRWCNKCQGLGYGGNASPGPCAARGDHSYTDSGDYSLLHDLSGVAGQNNWRWCRKCQGLAFAGNQGSHCPAGGTHDLSASYDYLLLPDTPIIDAQSDWRWCSKCQGLAFAGNSAGVCPAGGEHLLTRSFNYYLINV